jgi:hypothetical protein
VETDTNKIDSVVLALLHLTLDDGVRDGRVTTGVRSTVYTARR